MAHRGVPVKGFGVAPKGALPSALSSVSCAGELLAADHQVKYGLDRVVATAVLVVLTPALAAIAVAIKIDDGGPVLFRQERLGLNGRPFRVLKFRTMVVDADRYLDAMGRPTRERVTRVGRFLRSTSLDELPQLLNVIAGQMSLIGPRPALVSHLDRYTPAQRGRLRMKPGVTGLAQVTGRNSLPWSVRIELDNSYIDNYRPGLDAQILARTVYQVLTRSGVALDRNPETADDLAR